MIFKNVTKSFNGKKVLDDLSCTFKKGEINLLLGPSGVGKTTVLNILGGLLAIDEGEVLKDENLSITFSFQEDRLLDGLSVKSNLNLVMNKKLSDEELLSYLKRLNLDVSLNERVKNLSGGMKRRISLLRAIIPHPEVIVLDEAFAGLDEKNKRVSLLFLLEEMKGRTIIASTHDKALFEDLKTNIIDLEHMA